MTRSRLLLTLILGLLVALPSLALAQTSEVEIAEVNTSRYDEGGLVTLVVGFRNLSEPLDPAQLAITADGGAVENLDIQPLASSSVPVGVILAIDTSGSMEGAPMEAARAAARSFVQQKRPEDFVAIVTFADEVQVVQAFTNNVTSLEERIDALVPSGATAFNDAVVRSIDMFDDPSVSQLQPNIIILADGDDNGSTATAADVAAAVAGSDARIFGVALETEGFNPGAVQSVAEGSGGLFLLAPDPSQLDDLYGQIQREINNVLVARFSVPRPTPGEMAFAVNYGELTAETTAQVSGFVTTTTFNPVTTTVAFPEAQTFTVENTLPASAETMMLIGAIGTGAALALFIWILFGRKEEEGGGAFAKRLQAYGRQKGPQETEKRGLLDRLPLLRRFSQAAEQQVASRGMATGINAALEQANIPLSPGEAITASFGIAIIAGIFGWITGGVVGGVLYFGVVVVVVFGLIRWAGGREKRRFENQLPDTLTLLSTSLRAGYSLLQAVEAVASEAPDPTAREFGRAIAEARLGRSVTESLDGITARTQSKDFEWAVMAIEIQREVGGNLAEVLQTVADTMLQRNRLRGEIKALTAEGRISAFVLGSLPFVMGLFLWTSNREYIEPLFQETFGLIALAVGGVLMAAGIFWLRKIIDIDV
ncbi:MAG: type II secretion system F family protein [Acidimicrobiia bacterium]